MRRMPALLAAFATLVAALASLGAGQSQIEQWHLETIRATQAWEHGLGEGVVVAVIDGGVDYGHPEFVHTNFLPGLTIAGCEDSCGNGSREPTGEEMPGRLAHGTHVAGLIAAAHDGQGVRGVAPAATFLSIRALEDGSGDNADIARAIHLAVEAGADVINVSSGLLPPYDLTEEATGGLLPIAAAVEAAAAADVLVIGSAGNSAYPFCQHPASHASVICVVSVDRRESRSPYSNVGIRANGITVAAPGGGLSVLTAESDDQPALAFMCEENIVSTVVRDSARRGVADACGWGYDLDAQTGTSMAAPIVAGVAALVRAQGCSAVETGQILADTARPPMGLPVSPPWTGSGIVDADAAVRAAMDRC